MSRSPRGRGGQGEGFRVAIVTVLVLIAPRAALADGWTGAVALGTDFPVSISLRGEIETPSPHLRASTSVGILPSPYVSAINAFVIGIGGYS